MRALGLLLVLALLPGCASTDIVRDARGEGVTRTYAHPYDRAYDAVLSAARKKELEIVESDKAKGRILLSHGVTALSWGERIAVFLKPAAGGGRTDVEIVSKPVMSPLNFPPDWPKLLFEQIDAELANP